MEEPFLFVDCSAPAKVQGGGHVLAVAVVNVVHTLIYMHVQDFLSGRVGIG